MYFITALFIAVFACQTQGSEQTTKSAVQEKTTQKQPQGIPFSIQITLKNKGQAQYLRVIDPLVTEEAVLAQVLVPKGDSVQVELKGEVPAPGIYYLGTTQYNRVFIALGTKENIRLRGDLMQLPQTIQVIESETNKALYRFLKEISQYQTQLQQLQMQLQKATLSGNATLVQQTQQRIFQILKLQAAYQKRYYEQLATSEVLKRLARLYHFEPPPQGANQFAYFEKAFWASVDLQDTLYGYYPQTAEKARYYAQVLMTNLKDPTQVIERLNRFVEQLPQKSRLQKIIWRAFLVGLYQSNKDVYAAVAEGYIKTFPQDNLTKRIQPEVERILRLRIGAVAPDLELPTPDGKTLRISDFRGKYLLLDFWASWCGPCRRENPNVVRIYKKYKDKGFEILGISLDRDKRRWVSAIQQDGLTWYHMSDLQGWRSKAAQVYGVSYIPYTILLDKEGRIIAKNLRGAALENKLKEIFGE